MPTTLLNLRGCCLEVRGRKSPTFASHETEERKDDFQIDIKLNNVFNVKQGMTI